MVAASVVAACGGDDGAATDPPAAETTAAPEGATAAFNDADVMFAQGMIPHHEQAIAMAEIAVDPTTGAGPEVVELAGRIQAAQDPEIAMMKDLLGRWDQPLEMDTSDGHDMGDMGMMSAEEMDALVGLRGGEFDTAWLEAMIAHHEGAIAMATDVQAAGSNAEVRALAGQIVSGQQAEITEMRALLEG